jgi:nicotinate-nucleotide adenylyltransferase
MSSVAAAKRGRNSTPTNWIAPPGPAASGLRLGLLGGSFNPPHEGHVHASALALKGLQLDYVWWLVSPQNPLKPERGMESFERRLQAAREFARHPRIMVTGIEAELGTRFTADTLEKLKWRFPQLRFVWLMGSDNLLQIPRWRSWQDIFRFVPVAVVTRPGTAVKARFSKAAIRFKDAYRSPDRHFVVTTPPAWTILDGPRNPVSATALRAASRSLT